MHHPCYCYCAESSHTDVTPHHQSELRLNIGDELRLSCKCGVSRLVDGTKWEGAGNVLRIMEDGEVELELKCKQAPTDMTEGALGWFWFWFHRHVVPPSAVFVSS